MADDLRPVVDWAREHGKTAREIADALGVSLPTARRLTQEAGG